MRHLLIGLSLMCGAVTSACAQVSVALAVPGVSIGIHVPTYPTLVRVPGYPVYYSPQVQANFFFYDGMYWVYQDDDWYASTWYNGPWGLVAPEYVPVFVLRVPVRYYRAPPAYFRGWHADAPPRWDEHWGHDWSQQHPGWNQWRRRSAPPPAPLPSYQRHYPGERYPQQIDQQRTLRTQNYRYQPRDPVVRRHEQGLPAQPGQRAAPPAPSQRGEVGTPQGSRSRDDQGAKPRGQGGPEPKRGGKPGMDRDQEDGHGPGHGQGH